MGAAGQSCGGVEAYSASVMEPRVKVVGIYNTGIIDPGRRWYLKEMKQPIGYFHGGKGDFSYNYVSLLSYLFVLDLMGGRKLGPKLECLSIFKIEIPVGAGLITLKFSHSGIEI